jgi:uncharacterized sulfatase
VEHENDPEGRKFFGLAFGKRPGEELYDLNRDPDQIQNVAGDPAYAAVKDKLSAELMDELRRTGDPRVTGDGTTYDKPPFAGRSP